MNNGRDSFEGIDVEDIEDEVDE